LYQQFAGYVTDLLTGNFGSSYRSGLSVVDIIGAAVVPTITLAGAATLIALIFGLTTGLIAAHNHGRAGDTVTLLMSVFLISVPTFWIALMLIYVFSGSLHWFPSIGAGTEGNFWSQVHAIILPALALSTPGAAMISRVVRSSALEVNEEDYVVVARALGLKELRIARSYILRTSLAAVVSTTAVVFTVCVSNAVVIEAVFSRPGLGATVLNATLSRDYPVIQGTLITLAAVVVGAYLIADLLLPLVDPRVSKERANARS